MPIHRSIDLSQVCAHLFPHDIPFGDEDMPMRTPDDICYSGYILPEVESIAFHEENKTTVVRWADGTKTVVRCGNGETWSEYSAFVAAVAKKIFGSTSAVRKLIEECDVKRAAERREAKKREERRKQDEAAARNKERRIRRMARELAEMKEAYELYLSESEGPGGDEEDGANG